MGKNFSQLQFVGLGLAAVLQCGDGEDAAIDAH